MIIHLRYAFVLGALAACAIGLAGCQEPPAPEPKLLAEPSAIQVDKKTEAHTVMLDSAGRAGDLERRRLAAFISDIVGRDPAAVHVTIQGSQPAARLDGVAKLVVQQGIDPRKITLAVAQGPQRSVTVLAEKYVAEAPECPAWDTGPAATNNNSTRANLGCVNLSNLAAMVADPHDLIAGNSSTKADGQTSAAAVQRYHDDKVKDLPQHNVYVVGAGTGIAPTAGGQ
jgi:pilus assembly protein CpaD